MAIRKDHLVGAIVLAVAGLAAWGMYSLGVSQAHPASQQKPPSIEHASENPRIDDWWSHLPSPTKTSDPAVNYYGSESWYRQNETPGPVVGWEVKRSEAWCAPGRHLEPTDDCKPINGSMVCKNKCVDD